MACIRLGRFWFRRKGDAVAEVRRILHASTFDVQLVGDEQEIVRALFDLHPHSAEVKQRKGVLGFAVKENNFHGARTRGFHVLHGRDTTPFSYLTCFNPERAVPDPLATMRAAIILGQRTVLQAFFAGRQEAPCSYCATTTPKSGAHVHHEAPKFRAIAEDYFAAFGRPNCVSSPYLGDSFADLSEHNRWVKFHDERAIRVVVCSACNYADERKEAAE